MAKKFISLEDAVEAMWRILNSMGYSEKHNDRLVEDVNLELANCQTVELEDTDG